MYLGVRERQVVTSLEASGFESSMLRNIVTRDGSKLTGQDVTKGKPMHGELASREIRLSPQFYLRFLRFLRAKAELSN